MLTFVYPAYMKEEDRTEQNETNENKANWVSWVFPLH